MRLISLSLVVALMALLAQSGDTIFLPYASNVGCVPYTGPLRAPAGFDVYETSIDTEIDRNCTIFEAVQGKAPDGTFRVIVLRYDQAGNATEIPLPVSVYGGAEFEEFGGQLYIAAHNGDRQPQVFQPVPTWGQ